MRKKKLCFASISRPANKKQKEEAADGGLLFLFGIYYII